MAFSTHGVSRCIAYEKLLMSVSGPFPAVSFLVWAYGIGRRIGEATSFSAHGVSAVHGLFRSTATRDTTTPRESVIRFKLRR